MKKHLGTTLAFLAATLFFETSAHAQCSFNIGSGGSLKVPLVRAYTGCPSGAHTIVNTETQGGFSACTPVLPAASTGYCSITFTSCHFDTDCPSATCQTVGNPSGGRACASNADCVPFGATCDAVVGNVCEARLAGTDYKFGAKGGCSIAAKAKLEKDCSLVEDFAGTPIGLPPGPCAVTFVSSKCKDIRTSGDMPVGASDDGWALSTLTRASFDDPVNRAMTQIDFPVMFLYGTPNNGAFSLALNSAEVLRYIVGVGGGAALPPCTQLEFVNVELQDPNGSAFARVGLSTHP